MIRFKKVVAVAVALALAALCIVGAPARATTEPPAEPTLAPSTEPFEPEGPTDIGTPLTPEDDQPVTPQKRTATHSERELAETGKKEEGILVAGAIGVVLLGIGTAATLFARRREDRDG